MDFLEGLDGPQAEAATAGTGLLSVPAGAGTGKTTMLTARLAWLVRGRGADPRRIVATTFTRQAALEMRDRAAARGGDALAGCTVCTLHSLAARVARRHWEAAGLPGPDLLVADADEIRQLVSGAVDAAGVAGPAPPREDQEAIQARRSFVKLCIRKISRWKENGLTAAEAADASRPRRSAEDEDCAAVYVAFQEAMAERGMVDFGDLTMAAVRALSSDPAILDGETDRIEWFLLDEAQDTNLVQLALIRLLTSRCLGVTAVGDPDQSLYSFRGAIPDFMDRLPLLLPAVAARGFRAVPLVVNRRCTDGVLAPANMLVDHNRRRDPKVLASGRAGPAPEVASYATDREEGEAAADWAAALIAAGADPEGIAVLGRTKTVLGPVGLGMVSRRVRHAMQAGTGFMDRTEVRDVLAYLKLAMNPSLDTAFMRVAARPTRDVGPGAVARVLSVAAARGIPIHSALAVASEPGQGMNAPGRAGASLLGVHLESLAHAARSAETSERIVRFVFDEIRYSDWAFRQPDAPGTLKASLEGLLDMAREQPSFADFLSEISLLANPEDRAVDAVHVGTLHGSKGLEWDHVLIVGCEEGLLPSKMSMDEASGFSGDPDDPWETASTGGIEEERRLAHVGLTRARHTARMSFAAARGPAAFRKEGRPSRFLREAELEIPRPKRPMVQAKPAAGAKKKTARASYF